jgi:hypothetical protein
MIRVKTPGSWGKAKKSQNKPGQVVRVSGVWGSHNSRHSTHECGKVVSPTHRPPLPSGIILVLISVRGWVKPQDHIAAGRRMSIKSSSVTIGNRTRDLPACSTVPKKFWISEFTDVRHRKVAKLSILHNSRLLLISFSVWVNPRPALRPKGVTVLAVRR